MRHIGLSNVTPTQSRKDIGSPISFACRTSTIWCRGDDALVDAFARDGIAYVPFFPLGGFTRLQSSILSDVAHRLDVTPIKEGSLQLRS